MEHRKAISIAHRGAHDAFPENSLPAILRALDLGAQGIEIDVHATSDGVLVVHHDADLSDGRNIAELSAAEVCMAELAPGIVVPSLEAALEAVSGRAILFVETKVEGVEFALLRAIRRGTADAAVHSFHHHTMRNLKITMPALRAGILTRGSSETALEAARAARADDVWHRTDDIDGALVAGCHHLGKQVIAWTANSARECRRLEALGVDGICTDDLSLLSATVRSSR